MRNPINNEATQNAPERKLAFALNAAVSALDSAIEPAQRTLNDSHLALSLN